MNEEIWKTVVGFESHYEVSNLCNVRRKKSGRLRKIDKAQIYPTVLLSVNGIHKTFRVHRLVAKAFLTPIESKTHVNHKNGNQYDNRVENLEWVTQEENNLHSYRVLHRVPPMLGRIPPNRRVKDADIPEMDRMNKSGIPTDIIAKMYGVCGSVIRKHLRKYRTNG